MKPNINNVTYCPSYDYTRFNWMVKEHFPLTMKLKGFKKMARFDSKGICHETSPYMCHMLQTVAGIKSARVILHAKKVNGKYQYHSSIVYRIGRYWYFPTVDKFLRYKKFELVIDAIEHCCYRNCPNQEGQVIWTLVNPDINKSWTYGEWIGQLKLPM